MCEITKEECKAQLETLGVRYQKLPIAITRTVAKATSEIHGKTFQVEVDERVGYGIQITAKGNPKKCLISYQAMANMAEAMGIFDEELSEEEQQNG